MKDRYFCRMFKYRTSHFGGVWLWEVVTYNGHTIVTSATYKNKAQCRNVMRKFANNYGIEWREEK